MYESAPEVESLQRHADEARQELSQACEALARATMLGVMKITSQELPGFVRYLPVSNRTEVYWEGNCFMGRTAGTAIPSGEPVSKQCDFYDPQDPSEIWHLQIGASREFRCLSHLYPSEVTFTLVFLDQNEIPENQNPTS